MIRDPRAETKVPVKQGNRSLAKNAGIVSFYTMLSRITGLARDTIFGHMFGAGFETDAFLMAFTIPNAFRNLVAEGALTVAFLPVFKQTEKEGGDEATKRLMGQALGVFPLLASLVCILGMLFTPQLVFMFANGFHAVPGKFELTVQLTRAMFPYLALVSFVALTMGALNARAYFASSSASQLIFNSVHICVIIFFARLINPPMLGIACGVLTGGVAQVVVQVIALKQADLWVRLTHHLRARDQTHLEAHGSGRREPRHLPGEHRREPQLHELSRRRRGHLPL